MKTGVIIALIGLFLVGTTIALSTGLSTKMGMIENLQAEGQMYIIIKNGVHVINKPQRVYMDSNFDPKNYHGKDIWEKDEKGYFIIKNFTGWEGRKTIPSKYPFWASIIIIIIGIGKIFFGFISTYSSKVR